MKPPKMIKTRALVTCHKCGKTIGELISTEDGSVTLHLRRRVERHEVAPDLWTRVRGGPGYWPVVAHTEDNDGWCGKCGVRREVPSKLCADAIVNRLTTIRV